MIKENLYYNLKSVNEASILTDCSAFIRVVGGLENSGKFCKTGITISKAMNILKILERYLKVVENLIVILKFLNIPIKL